MLCGTSALGPGRTKPTPTPALRRPRPALWQGGHPLPLRKPSRKRPPDHPTCGQCHLGSRRAGCRRQQLHRLGGGLSPARIPFFRCTCSFRPAGGGTPIPSKRGGSCCPRRRRLLSGRRGDYCARVSYWSPGEKGACVATPCACVERAAEAVWGGSGGPAGSHEWVRGSSAASRILGCGGWPKGQQRQPGEDRHVAR